MNMWGKRIPSRKPGRQVQRPYNKMCLAYSRSTKEASVIPGQRVRVGEVRKEFEGTARIKSYKPIVMSLDFILRVKKPVKKVIEN